MRTLRNNRGVTLVFVAMGLLIFLLFLGLALDTGWLVYVRAQGQTRIDAAALAAGAGLVKRSAGERRQQAKELADAFSQKNLVNTTGTPENILVPMSYAAPPIGDGVVKESIDGGWAWGANGLNCNAVQVTTTVPTSVFFAGIRNVFGAGETGQENITVSAVSHLPCPGIITRDDGKLARLAISQAFWDFPAGCNVSHSLLELLNAALATLASLPPLPVQVGTLITLQPVPTELEELQTLLEELFPLPCPSTVIVPVVDDVNPGSKLIKGFAAICWDPGSGEGVSVKLQCGEVAPSSAGTGGCFGTYASNPILIR